MEEITVETKIVKVDQNTIDEQKPLTQIDPSIFQQMKTNEGVTISDLNKKGYKVLLILLTSVGCPFCQGTMLDIYNIKDQLLILNTIPVILHDEDNETYATYINTNENTKKFEEFQHLERKGFTEHFKLEHMEKNFSTFIYMIGNGLKEMLRMKNLGYNYEKKYFSKETETLLAGVFVIHDEKVVSEFRKKRKHQRYDVARIVIDTDGFGIDVHTSVFECEIPKKTKTFEKSQSLNLRKSISFSKKNSFRTQNLNMDEVLNNQTYFKYFKLHATSEYSVENLVFYEEVHKYKKMGESQRKERSKQMVEVFFASDSVYQINTTKTFMDKVNEGLETSDVELFDSLLKDVVQSNLLDMFQRFMTTERYQQMLEGKKVKILFIA